MPITAIGSADATARCRDRSCRGHHDTARVSVPLRVQVWTQRVGDSGPVTVARSEQSPLEISERDRTCRYCGGRTEISPLRTLPHHRVVWPEVTPTAATPVDEVIVPEQLPTLDEQVAELEERLAAVEELELRVAELEQIVQSFQARLNGGM